jgi:hypothetical protein
VQFNGRDRKVVDGPFAETKELIAGYWLWQCKSLEEAIEWAKKCPNPMNEASEIEIRELHTEEVFGDALTPELKQRNDELRKQTGGAAQ